MAGNGAGSNELVRYLAVPLRRWRLVATVVVLGVVLTSLYVFSRHETYTANSLVDLHEITTSPFDATKSSDQLIDVATEAKTATSEIVAAQASTLLSGHPSTGSLQRQVTVTVPSGTTTLNMAFTAGSPKAAAAGANAFAQAYLSTRQLAAETRRTQLTETINQSAESLQTQLTKIGKSLAGADPTSSAAQNDITTRTLLTQQYSDLTQRENALTGMSVDPGQVVSAATPGGASASPNKKILLVGGFMIFLIIGLVAALIRERFDRRLRTPEQLEEILDAGVVSTKQATRYLRAAMTSPDDAMYVLRSRVLNAAPSDNSEVLLLLDCADPSTAGSVGAQLAQLMANTGAPVRLVMVSESEEMPSWFNDDDPLFGKNSRLRTDWLRLSDPDNVMEANLLSAVMDDVRQVGQIAVLATVGQPRRSLIVALSNLADDVIVVAQAGYSDTTQVRQTAQDVVDSGTQIFGGVLVQSRRFGRAESKSTPAARASGRPGQGSSAGTEWLAPKAGAGVPARRRGGEVLSADAGSISAVPPGPNTIPLELRLREGKKAVGQPAGSISNGKPIGYGNDSRSR